MLLLNLIIKNFIILKSNINNNLNYILYGVIYKY